MSWNNQAGASRNKRACMEFWGSILASGALGMFVVSSVHRGSNLSGTPLAIVAQMTICEVRKRFHWRAAVVAKLPSAPCRIEIFGIGPLVSHRKR
ncbi:hypothetical protein KC347_g19 [Hortaea werneckii]|nr:hypothetical protein KC347_g19 [Hortaea werneckii]